MLRSNICECVWLLECGAVKQWEWTACMRRTVCLRIGLFRTGNRAGARVHSFDLTKEARKMAKFARCPFAKTTANCFNSSCHFHLISSMSQPQLTAFDLMLPKLNLVTLKHVFNFKLFHYIICGIYIFTFYSKIMQNHDSVHRHCWSYFKIVLLIQFFSKNDYISYKAMQI